MRKILICEDEDAIRDFVVINLERSGYETVDVACGEDAIKAFDEHKGNFDLALLDINLPGIDGFAVCKHLREKSDTLGIIMLTANTQEMDKVRGLMLGADDYVTKPFSPAELVARIDAIYRRVSMATSSKNEVKQIESGPFLLDCKQRTLKKNNEDIELTQVEYQIMEYFIKNKNIALERNSILEHIWGNNYYGDDKIVDVNVRRLRMKIEDEPSKPIYIQTIWGYGYKWQDNNKN